jgi:hypothetical protein
VFAVLVPVCHLITGGGIGYSLESTREDINCTDSLCVCMLHLRSLCSPALLRLQQHCRVSLSVGE